MVAVQKIVDRFVRFAGVGAVGTACQYLVLMGLVEIGRAGAVTASVVGALMGALINYLLNYHYTFKSRKRHVEAAPKFLAISGVSLAVNAAVMYLAVHMFKGVSI